VLSRDDMFDVERVEGHQRLGNAAILAMLSGSIDDELANVRLH
jgi:hypothetical protein